MMKDRKAQMALEYIAKLMIIVVVIAVVIGMMFHFKKDTVKKWKTISDPDGDEEPDPNAAFIEGEFKAPDIAGFITTCWTETRDAEDSKVCFVLKGSYISANPPPLDNAKEISDITDPYLLDADISSNAVFDVDFSKDLFSINYEIIGNEIHIKS